MRILAISDEESKYLWEYFDKNKLKDIDLIISCGDLAPEYLSFLVTLSSVPVLYVHGNHDEKYDMSPALKTRSMCIKGCGFWDWGGLCVIAQGNISIPNGR